MLSDIKIMLETYQTLQDLKRAIKEKKMLPEGPVRVGGWLRLKKYNKFFSGSLVFFQ